MKSDRMKSNLLYGLGTALLLASANAAAYIGPGAGLSVLGSLWALLVGVALALFAILSWPLRILWRRLRGKRKDATVDTRKSA